MATMKLQDKGQFQPVPELEGFAQEVSAEVQKWPGVVSATHWYLRDRNRIDGADFYVGETELGHIHLDGELHLVLSKTLATRLLKDRLASPFRWDAAWVTYRIESPATARHALWLMRLRYALATGASEHDILRAAATPLGAVDGYVVPPLSSLADA